MPSSVITNKGKAAVAAKLIGVQNPYFHNETHEDVFKYIAVGAAATAPSVEQESLVTELSGSLTRKAGEVSLHSGMENVLYVDANFQCTASPSETIQEAGLFSQEFSAENGTMLVRGTFDPIELSEGDLVDIEFKITIGDNPIAMEPEE